jgi:beta-aspartyl-peptidase (threonine type)
MALRSLAVLALVLAGCTVTGAPPSDPTGGVRAMLDASADAWNRGDLDAFVGDYVDDSTTTFVSRGQVQYGFDWIRDNYAPSFDPDVQRDSLRFETVAARSLGSDHALATARFVLFRGDSVTASGPFTLILKRSGSEWKIIHDHTSTD